MYLEKLEDFEKVLYLDSDLVVLDALEEIFGFTGPIVARRQEHDLASEYTNPKEIVAHERLEQGDEFAFLNGGVVCFDRNYWVEHKILDQALTVVDKYGWGFFKNSDQGVLNILARRHGGFTEMPIVYNFCRWPDMMNGTLGETATNRFGLKAPVFVGANGEKNLAKVVHWNGPVKPWEFEAANVGDDERKKLYYECYRSN